MSIQTAAGTTLGVSAVLPASQTSGAYAALTFTAVGEIVDNGSFGKTYNEVSFTALSDRRKRKFKGSYDVGSLQLQLGRDMADAGQDVLRAALESDNDYAFKVTLQNGEITYFQAKVMSFQTKVGSVDNIVGADCTLGINTDIIEV